MPDYDQQTSDPLDRFHQLKDQIGMLRSEQSILRDLKDVLKELKAATLSGDNLQQDVALSNAFAILKLVEPRLGKPFTARGWVRGADAGVSILLASIALRHPKPPAGRIPSVRGPVLGLPDRRLDAGAFHPRAC